MLFLEIQLGVNRADIKVIGSKVLSLTVVDSTNAYLQREIEACSGFDCSKSTTRYSVTGFCLIVTFEAKELFSLMETVDAGIVFDVV